MTRRKTEKPKTAHERSYSSTADRLVMKSSPFPSFHVATLPTTNNGTFSSAVSGPTTRVVALSHSDILSHSDTLGH